MNQNVIHRVATPWEDEFWTVPRMWEGETVFVLGSGPSLNQFDVDRVRGRGPVVAVNSSYLLAPWADALFFTDGSWFEQHREVVEKWPGLVLSMSKGAKRELPRLIKRIAGEQRRDFPRPGALAVRQGRSSGQSAASVALQAGASVVVLMGFDMRIVSTDDGKKISHFHNQYGKPTEPSVFTELFLPDFAGWNEDALRVGCTILNATPGSAIEEFSKVDLTEFLIRGVDYDG